MPICQQSNDVTAGCLLCCSSTWLLSAVVYLPFPASEEKLRLVIVKMSSNQIPKIKKIDKRVGGTDGSNNNSKKRKKSDQEEGVRLPDYTDTDEECQTQTAKKALSGDEQDEFDQMRRLVQQIQLIPKLPARNRPQLNVYIVTNNKQSVIGALNLRVNIEKGIFKKVVSEIKSNPKLIMVILNNQADLPILEGMLKGTDSIVHLRNPTDQMRKSLIIVDFELDNLSRDSIRNEIVKGNPELKLKEDEVMIYKLLTSKRPFCAVVNITNESSYEMALENETIKIGSSTAEVYVYTNVDFCIGCCQFGHRDINCEFGLIKICARCGESGHVIGVCTKINTKEEFRYKPVCFNCKLRGDKYNHLASALFCDYRLAYMKRRVEEKQIN